MPPRSPIALPRFGVNPKTFDGGEANGGRSPSKRLSLASGSAAKAEAGGGGVVAAMRARERAALAAKGPEKGGAAQKVKHKATINSGFQSELEALMAELRCSRSHFVRRLESPTAA